GKGRVAGSRGAPGADVPREPAADFRVAAHRRLVRATRVCGAAPGCTGPTPHMRYSESPTTIMAGCEAAGAKLTLLRQRVPSQTATSIRPSAPVTQLATASLPSPMRATVNPSPGAVRSGGRSCQELPSSLDAAA